MAGGEHQSKKVPITWRIGVCLCCQGFGQVEFPRLPSKNELLPATCTGETPSMASTWLQLDSPTDFDWWHTNREHHKLRWNRRSCYRHLTYRWRTVEPWRGARRTPIAPAWRRRRRNCCRGAQESPLCRQRTGEELWNLDEIGRASCRERVSDQV